MAHPTRSRFVPGQNFLRSSSLVRRLLQASTIGPADMVYEIGAGRGRITAELARAAGRVIAIETDPALARYLHIRFQDARNVRIVERDYLEYHIPDREYKIFANIPYHITARIVRKILTSRPAPCDAYLVMQKEAAQKFSGSPRETRFSVLAKPAWRIRILRELRRTDFEPAPQVDSVLLHLEKRRPTLVSPADLGLYRDFVCYGFGGWKKSLKLNFKQTFTYRQWKRLADDLSFAVDALPSELSFAQWLGLFDYFRQTLPRRR